MYSIHMEEAEKKVYHLPYAMLLGCPSRRFRIQKPVDPKKRGEGTVITKHHKARGYR